MSRPVVVVGMVLAVVLIEAIAVVEARGSILPAAGIPVALALTCRVLVVFRDPERTDDATVDDIENGPAETLHRWHAKAQMLADRADGTRADWDRHLRPMLAEEFEMSANVRVTNNRRALERMGINQFGAQLWRWVDPADSNLRDHVTPAPGRAALDEILRRLQRM